MTKISDERLAEMMAGLEGVTPGPWFADQLGDGSSDEWIVCAPNIEAVPVSGVKFRDDACHIGNCDPDTIRSILTELQQLRAHNSDSAEPVGVVVATGNDPDVVWYEGPELSIGAELYLAPPPAKEVTEEMIERVARALAAEGYEDRNAFDDLRDGESQVFMTKNDFRHLARVALTGGGDYALTNRTPDDEVGNG